MKLNQNKNYTEILIEDERLDGELFTRMEKVCRELTEENIVLNLSGKGLLRIDEVLLFVPLSEHHTRYHRSFVVVTPHFDAQDVEESIAVVPTLEEALDYIEMEELQRELDQSEE